MSSFCHHGVTTIAGKPSAGSVEGAAGVATAHAKVTLKKSVRVTLMSASFQ